ncbi:MAG TPA: MFS transporter [Acidimicrobiales bacterium]|nr:MFS transporter [Acidimicrobiales bacterium]
MASDQETSSKSLWRHRDFRLLWAGQSVSELGSQVTSLALPLLAIDRLHAGAFALGLLTTMSTLPFLLVGLPAGAWIDRARKRPVLIGADVGRALVLGSVPLAWAFSVLTMTQLYVVSLVAGILTVFFDVAYQSYLPALVTNEKLVEGNAKLAGSMSSAQVAGPAVAGLLVKAVGAANAVLIDAASFVASFVSLIAIRSPEERRVRASGEARTTLRTEIAEGLRFVWHEPLIRSVSLSTATSNFFGTMAFSVTLLFFRKQIHLSPAHIGLLLTAGGVGGVFGASFAARIARRFGVGRTILFAIMLSGIGQLANPLVTPADANALIIVGELLLGAGSVIYNINQVSVRQAICPLPLQGRMNASVRTIVWGCMPIGAFIGGVLGATIGLRATLWVGGIGAFTAFGWIMFSPVHALRVLPSSASEQALS